VRTKLVPPALPDTLVARARVMGHVSSERRVTLVSAMPGFGKTALVRQWIDTLDVPVAWLSLDLLDQDPSTFWAHLLMSLGAVAPGVDSEPSALLWERGANDRLFLSALIAGLAEIDGPIVLVLDGLPQELDRTALEGLALLVERVGDTLRLVATTRSDPQLPLARWRSLGWLADVREDDLRLTDDEAVAIARAADTSIRDEADIVALNRRVEGWPIALRMALLARPADAPPRPTTPDLLAGTDRLLADYLAAEVLATLTDEEREVALALSVLQWFDPDLCADLIGAEGAGVVRSLLRRGMLLSVVDPRTGTMRFHDLFRELMEIELGSRDPDQRLRLHRRAAVLWRARGDLLSAYHHLSVIGETPKAHELLVGPAFELVDRGDLRALRAFARQLPTQTHVHNASLALDLATVATYSDGTLAARRWCERAATLIATDRGRGVDDDHALALRLNGIECGIDLLEADLDAAIMGIESHRKLVEGIPVADVAERRFPILAARVMLGARRMEDAATWIALADEIDGPGILTDVAVPTLRAWYEWLFGSLRRCSELVDGALTWMAEHRVGPHHLAFDTLITGGWTRLSTGHIAEAADLADRAWADAETLGYSWFQLQAGFLGARLALVTGDPTRALRLLEELGAVVDVERCRTYTDRLAALEVEALAGSGRTLEAARLIDTLEPGPRRRLLVARFHGESDREVEALLADRDAWPMLERVQAELVLCSRRQGAESSEALTALLARGGESGWVMPFLGCGPRVERLLRSMPLDVLHPRLAATLASIAPSSAVREDAEGVRLTSRELSLVELLPTHLSYAEIGERLFLSVNTVKSNLKALYRKLDATTRTEAVEAGRQAGLI
jgi:LuxR family maltose regulon positive regulatory protein